MQIQFVNALVSMRRLSQYFLLEDRKDATRKLDKSGIRIDDADFFWAKPPAKIVMPEIGKKKKKKPVQEQPHAEKNKEMDSGKLTPSSASSEGSPKKADADKPVEQPSKSSIEAAWWLKNINLELNAGELVCVVGRVGSGKSSLAQAILGEMESAKGTVGVGGKLAYAAQQPWIINASLEDNITFGRPYNHERWEQAVDACCLAQDIEILPAGAETEIGEKGINLSGGQKQRVSLARSLYQNADVYILDDPLSAVDVHVGRHIFEKFINGVIKSKARLLVTNQLNYVPQADKVILLENGEIKVQGTYEECLKCESFVKLLSEHNAKAEEEVKEEVVDEKKAAVAARSDLESKTVQRELAANPGAGNRITSMPSMIQRSETFVKIPDVQKKKYKTVQNSGLTRLETMKQENEKPVKGALIVKEDKEVGHVTGKVYWRYIKAYGIIAFIALAVMWSSEQTLRVLTNWYLAKWTNAELENSQNPGFDFNRYTYVGGYLGFAFGFIVLTSLRSLMNLLSALGASRIIHLNTLSSLVRAPVTFFDTTPVGRILNRFSKVCVCFLVCNIVSCKYKDLIKVVFEHCRILMMWTFCYQCP